MTKLDILHKLIDGAGPVNQWKHAPGRSREKPFAMLRMPCDCGCDYRYGPDMEDGGGYYIETHGDIKQGGRTLRLSTNAAYAAAEEMLRRLNKEEEEETP